MTRICPQCSSPNEDNKKFCTNCGIAIETLPAPSGTPPAQKAISARIPVAGIIIIVVTVLFIIPAWGKPGIPQQSGATLTPKIPAPVITSFVRVETPFPEPSSITAVCQTSVKTSGTTQIPRTNPTVTEAAVCAADRRPCNNT